MLRRGRLLVVLDKTSFTQNVLSLMQKYYTNLNHGAIFSPEMAIYDKQALLRLYAADILTSPMFLQEQSFIQHGRVSVYAHSVAVAQLSIAIARRLRLKVNEKAMTRGALLHDYFLYDWHVKDDSHRWHGFHHADKARVNAVRDFNATLLEQHIIERHMFPLNIKPPMRKEGIVVCLADKLCAFRELFIR